MTANTKGTRLARVLRGGILSPATGPLFILVTAPVIVCVCFGFLAVISVLFPT